MFNLDIQCNSVKKHVLTNIKMYSNQMIICILCIISSAWGQHYEKGGMCAPYGGKICKNYRGGRQVWFPSTGGLNNEQITIGLWEEMISTLKEPCKSAAKVGPYTLLPH